MGPAENYARLVLQARWAEYFDQPASLSGKYHCGETMFQHLETVVSMTDVLCSAHQLDEIDRDILRAAAWLHDIGRMHISFKGKHPAYTFYPHNGWSRNENMMPYHAEIGARIIDGYYELPYRERIRRLVLVHMNGFYSSDYLPESLHEYIICEADYLSIKLPFTQHARTS